MNPWDEKFDGLLRQYVPSAAPGEPVPPDIELVVLGVESIALLQLMLCLESDYGIHFPMDMLTEEVFRTARSIWTAMVSLQQDSRG
jgi:acyl carrier protein